jgi:hypothetical protein
MYISPVWIKHLGHLVPRKLACIDKPPRLAKENGRKTVDKTVASVKWLEA